MVRALAPFRAVILNAELFFLKPVYYPSSECGFDRHDISRAALQVVNGLQKAGFEAYLVGGCIRDLLMDFEPKDFDITTDASPEEVHRIFRRSRIIGRRFRLVHVRFGREVIEVATYRANPAANRPKKNRWMPWKKVTSNSGRILDDNVYGTIEDDAVRRDFTVNALYYDHSEEQVIDFLGGVDDLDNNILRIIGDPDQRLAEDPVRMLRVVRFMAKLGLEPTGELMASVLKNNKLIGDVPAARLYDEVLKMFHHAHAVDSWHELNNAGLTGYLFPQTARIIQQEGGERWEQLVIQALQNTDRRIAANKPVIPAFLYVVILWRPYCLALDNYQSQGLAWNEASEQAGEEVFSKQCRQVAIPRRTSAPAVEVWKMQRALESRRPKNIVSLLANRRFRAAYDFLLLRGRIGDVSQSLTDWWTRIQDVNESVRQQMVDELRNGSSDAPRKNVKRLRPEKRKRAARKPTNDRA